MPHSHLAQILVVFGVLAIAAADAQAQVFGGGMFGGGASSADDLFHRLDRDDDDQIEPDEWEAAPLPLRRMFEGRADLARAMRIEQYREIFQALREDMMSRMNGGGGFGRGFDEGGRRGGDDRGRFGSRDEYFDRGRRGNDEQPSPDSSADGKNEDATTPHAPMTRPRINFKLPDKYQDRDKNKDGQIGLYEWPRNDYAGFKKLDHNGDGFLTPQELIREPRATVATRAGTAPTVSAPATSTSGNGKPSSTAGGAGSPASPADRAFNLVDRDKDGRVSEGEWDKSMLAKKKFEAAGIAVTFPLSRDEFRRNYPRAYSSSGN